MGGRKPPHGGGRQDRDGDPPGTAQGRAVLAQARPGAPSRKAGAPSTQLPTVTHRGSAQRRGSITCFSRQEGWTCFYPKRRNETRLPGPFHYQDLSGVVLTRCRLLSVYVIICLKCEFYMWKSSVLLENSICLLALHDEEDKSRP